MVIVGQLGTTADVAAVGTGSLIMQALTAVVAGLSTGTTVRLGHCIGSGDKRAAGETLGGMIALFVLLSLVLTVVMIIFAETLAGLMSVPAEAFDKTVSYITICSAGTFFIASYNGIAGIFRGLGDSKSPLIFVIIACGLNIIGDLFCVGVLKLGTAGAAYATVFAQAVSVLFSIFYIWRRGLPFPFAWGMIFRSGAGVNHILRIGIPVAAQDLLNYFSFMILASIINSLGLIASAAIAVEGKVFSFFILVPFFIENCCFHSGNTAVVKFDGIDSAEEARIYANTDVYFPIKYMEEDDDISSWDFFIDFRVEDIRYGDLGRIVRVDDSTMNVLFVIEREGKEILLPAHEEFIRGLNKKTRTLTVEVPDGLLS